MPRKPRILVVTCARVPESARVLGHVLLLLGLNSCAKGLIAPASVLFRRRRPGAEALAVFQGPPWMWAWGWMR
eukprot:389670-Pyramimonas_sp.AAC.1